MSRASATQTAGGLAALLQTVPARLAAISEADATRQPAEGRWSKKEILGHLVDSAGNNHQRFVRAQFAPHIDLPGYEQERWVAAQQYAAEPWADLVNLWLSLNRHLLHVVRAVPAAALANTISIGGREPVTLGFVIDDYLGHLQHHLEQIL
jgi:hypothetical protein